MDDTGFWTRTAFFVDACGEYIDAGFQDEPRYVLDHTG